MYSEWGGAKIGSGLIAMNATWPLAKLAVDSSSLELYCLFSRWSFPKQSVVAVHRYSGVCSKGVRIEHTIKDHNPFIVFWTFRRERLIDELVRHGYPVI